MFINLCWYIRRTFCIIHTVKIVSVSNNIYEKIVMFIVGGVQLCPWPVLYQAPKHIRLHRQGLQRLIIFKKATDLPHHRTPAITQHHLTFTALSHLLYNSIVYCLAIQLQNGVNEGNLSRAVSKPKKRRKIIPNSLLLGYGKLAFD